MSEAGVARVKLNLGCGNKKIDGFVNVDLYGTPDMRVDLFEFPWPWETGSIDEIQCDNFFEHVQSFRQTFRECYRILKVGGLLHIIVPHFRGCGGPWPDQHHYSFGIGTFANLCAGLDYDMPDVRFKTLVLRHKYGPRFRLFTPFANLHPLAWEYFNLPVSEIEWIGAKL
jgi:SAM-dependent methyltransferase